MSSQDQTTQDQTVSPDIQDKLATHDVLETAAADGSFGEFLAAVRATGLENLLSGAELITVFAPTDDAFQRFHGAKDWQHRLGELVRDHMMTGAWTADELGKSGSLKTLQGRKLETSKQGEEVRIGGAKVVRADIECTNGVLHAIDTVLFPSE